MRSCRGCVLDFGFELFAAGGDGLGQLAQLRGGLLRVGALHLAALVFQGKDRGGVRK